MGSVSVTPVERAVPVFLIVTVKIAI